MCDQIKDNTEGLVCQYLRKNYGENVIPHPYTDGPPDIELNTAIGVEVRRLNKFTYLNKFYGNQEHLPKAITDAYGELLKSFDSDSCQQTYLICLDFNLPLVVDFRNHTKQLNEALEKFLRFESPTFPYSIQVDGIRLKIINEIPLIPGKRFHRAWEEDLPLSSELPSFYAKNICVAIKEKSCKVRKYISRYNYWWLFLVDYIRDDLRPDQIQPMISLVGDTRPFKRVCLLDYYGTTPIADLK